jgi:hypothetical protein
MGGWLGGRTLVRVSVIFYGLNAFAAPVSFIRRACGSIGCRFFAFIILMLVLFLHVRSLASIFIKR